MRAYTQARWDKNKFPAHTLLKRHSIKHKMIKEVLCIPALSANIIKCYMTQSRHITNGRIFKDRSRQRKETPKCAHVSGEVAPEDHMDLGLEREAGDRK